MSTIVESEWRSYLQNDAVTHIEVLQCENKKYRVKVKLNWKEGEQLLMAARGKPREYADIETIVSLISDNMKGKAPPINLTLYQSQEKK